MILYFAFILSEKENGELSVGVFFSRLIRVFYLLSKIKLTRLRSKETKGAIVKITFIQPQILGKLKGETAGLLQCRIIWLLNENLQGASWTPLL